MELRTGSRRFRSDGLYRNRHEYVGYVYDHCRTDYGLRPVSRRHAWDRALGHDRALY